MNTPEKTVDIYNINVFTKEMNGGSPTAVVFNADELTDEVLHGIAREADVSHTAFIFNADTYQFNIRFFTKEGEIKNCAHASIAAGYLYASKCGITDNATYYQKTISGTHKIYVTRQGNDWNVYLTQNEIIFKPAEDVLVDELLSTFRISIQDLDDRYPVILASPGSFRALIPLRSESILQELKPDFQMLRSTTTRHNIMGCFAFTMLPGPHDFFARARMFAPAIGVNEDLINGNSTGCLAAYLLNLGMMGTEKTELRLTVEQGHSFNRIGTVMANSKQAGSRIHTVISGTSVITGQRKYLINSSPMNN